MEMKENKTLVMSPENPVWTDVFTGEHSLRYWLLLAPVFIVLFYQVGRGLGNTSYVLYWFTAVLVHSGGYASLHAQLRVPAGHIDPVCGAIGMGTLSAALSINPDGAYGKWGQYALLGSSYFITWALVRAIPEFSLERAIRMIGVADLIGFVYYAARFLILSMSPDFHPELQVHGLVLAYLASFALYSIRQNVKGKNRVVLSLAYLASLTLLLVFSNSLTEVLTLAGALAVLVFFVVPNKRLLMLALGGTKLLFIALILAFDPAGHVLS